MLSDQCGNNSKLFGEWYQHSPFYCHSYCFYSLIMFGFTLLVRLKDEALQLVFNQDFSSSYFVIYAGIGKHIHQLR
uniref:Uncharacterized protein n=1 Tax=Sphingobacterium sp. (strain 21) TaxID=743722 RepID=F4CBA0_SPHS2